MKLIANYKRKIKNEDNEVEVSFIIPSYQSKYLNELDKTKEYSIEIKEKKSQRSIQQNKKLWKLISLIAKEQNEDDMKVYCDLLESTNCKYEYLMGTDEIEDSLKKNFRAVKKLRYEDYKGKRMAIYKCYIGSSKYTVSEMMELIEKAINWAYSLGIEVDNDEY